MNINETLAAEFSLRPEQVEKTVALIDEGNTIPFIARYRKEVTGSLDDTVLRDLYDRLTFLRNLQKRKEEVAALIAGQEKMTPEIQAAIDAAKTITEVEDIYRPFRPHRKTRASVAREKGLEPLAELLMAQEPSYTPSAYLTNYRMHKATELLRDCRVKVYEVAESVGYRDITYFSSAFKKSVGMSPSEYQKRCQ